MSLFTEGKLFKKAGEGSGGGDSHNLGWYATSSDLTTAYPTATAGDWAIVGATDTVWVWDTDNSQWVDTDQKGQVTSVNNQTGAVTITADDILPSQTGNSGKILTTDGFVSGWVLPEIVQRSTMPQASEDESGKIYQYVGTTDANYTNGYYYKCVSDGLQPATYSWERIDVQPSPVIPDPLPSQTGNSGKFLTTNGTDASWAAINALQNTATYPTTALTLLGTPTTGSNGINIGDNSIAGGNAAMALGSKAEAFRGSVSIGVQAKTKAQNGVSVGPYCESEAGVTLGVASKSEDSGIAIGNNAYATASNFSIQLGRGTNTDSGTFKVSTTTDGTNWNNYEMMSADGTIPTARLTKVNSTITLTSAGWSSNTQTVNVTGMTATGIVLVSPDPTDQSAYTSAGIICSAQAAGTLTFTCDTVPSGDIDVNVVML